MRIGLLAATMVWFSTSAGAAVALASNETDFYLISRMPAIEGNLRQTVESADVRSGLAVRKRLYVYEHDGFELWTHVVEAACSDLAEQDEPAIIALQYFPKDPKTFTTAAMPDLYLEVFARDDERRVRVYQELSGRQMAELTDRFMPVCRNL